MQGFWGAATPADLDAWILLRELLPAVHREGREITDGSRKSPVVQEDLKLMQKRLNYMTVASNDLGAGR